VEKFVECQVCNECAKPVPTGLWQKNAGLCGVCACWKDAVESAIDHAELERVSPRAFVKQARI
jgi:hypothetical protein